MSAYSHSETFAQLRGINESISSNLSSVQYMRTLDDLLNKCVLSIFSSSKFVDIFLMKVLAWQSVNPRRKSCACGRGNLSSYATLVLLLDTPEDKMKAFSKIGLDRGITSEMIRRYLQVMEAYSSIVNNPVVTTEDVSESVSLLASIGSHEELHPYGAYLQVKFWFEKACSFRSMILEKYVRLCLSNAQQDYVALDHVVPLNDIIQVYLMAASKAIDKCDPERGVLTTHIQHWLMSAKNTVTRAYTDGIKTVNVDLSTSAFLDKVAAAQDSNEVEAFSNETTDSKLERLDTIYRVRQIAEFFDPRGYARLVLNINNNQAPECAYS